MAEQRLTSDGPVAAPFVYIASLRRSGSTVLSEALTGLPHAYMFREPRLGLGHFSIKRDDQALFASHGVDLKAYSRAFKSAGPAEVVRRFALDVMPALRQVVSQIGIKEIRSTGWELVAEHFPDMRVLITGRDPRDIYLSLRQRVESGTAGWNREVTPSAVADHLLAEYDLQCQMEKALPSLRVSYERLCTEPEVIEQVKAFVASPLPGTGTVSAFNAANPKRAAEAAVHGGSISDRRVDRWRREPDPERAAEAQELFDRMGRYVGDWGYAKI